MAHYAFIDENNIVVDVIVGRNENEVVDGISDWEQHYSELRGLRCLRTSYNTYGNEHLKNGVPFRKNYAAIGYSYSDELDAFIPTKSFDSWIFDEETCTWNPPIDRPENGGPYQWDEETVSWKPLNA